MFSGFDVEGHIQFSATDREQAPAILRITNSSSHRAAFKLKMSSAIELVASPRMAALEPHETIVLQIWLVKHDRKCPCGPPEKLVILGTVVPTAWTIEQHKKKAVVDVFDEGTNQDVVKSVQQIIWRDPQDEAKLKVFCQKPLNIAE
jgi:hypothetical protein